MTKQKPTEQKIIRWAPDKVIRYWHPHKGGWYHARLVKLGRKWAVVEPLAQLNGIVFAFNRKKRVPVTSIKEIAQ